MSYRALLPIERIRERIELAFPRSSFPSIFTAPGTAVAVAAMLYVDAVVPDDGDQPSDANWARPSLCLWLSEAAYARQDAASRAAWYRAATGGKARRAVEQLHADWGEEFKPLYADNTREGIRDEVFPKWASMGAMRLRAGLSVTSPLPRWALTASFADLFDPALQGLDVQRGVDAWVQTRLEPGARAKVLFARQAADASFAVSATLPSGEERLLEPGKASLILKGVIESWLPVRLKQPVVIHLSQPGSKLYQPDQAVLAQLGLRIDQRKLLPDLVVVDLGAEPAMFWFVEVVATGGPIDDERKAALLNWARRHRIAAEQCGFLTAFESRQARPARKWLSALAPGTYAWYADEPGRELDWYEIAG